MKFDEPVGVLLMRETEALVYANSMASRRPPGISDAVLASSSSTIDVLARQMVSAPYAASVRTVSQTNLNWGKVTCRHSAPFPSGAEAAKLTEKPYDYVIQHSPLVFFAAH